MKLKTLIFTGMIVASLSQLKADDPCDNYTAIDPNNFTCQKVLTKTQLLAQLSALQDQMARIDKETAAFLARQDADKASLNSQILKLKTALGL